CRFLKIAAQMPHIPQNPRMDSAEVRPIRGFFTMHDRCTVPIENRSGIFRSSKIKTVVSFSAEPLFPKCPCRRPAPMLISGPGFASDKYKCVFSRKPSLRSVVFRRFLLLLQLFWTFSLSEGRAGFARIMPSGENEG
ncbi:hypothetical protein, partial [Alistipes shahii]|uniref:hypothetical protein n=1 Tax=Alistipes shahii TaxID=328814 RepID=UPI003AF69810